ncbi:MAG TPA: TerB family tellurite resistance protein [Gammaproteobacteria bacterium]|nr:TerB family tellurite resistance protein [Gammaproteobacteria bacterium]
MLNAIKNFFEQNVSSSESRDREHQLKLATGALLLEMMKQDHTVTRTERKSVNAILQTEFGLSDEETHELYQHAADEASEAVDYFQFTSFIARECSQDEKIRIIEYLWTIAYADARLDALEEHMIRRITDLIYVSHRDMIQAKHRVQDKMKMDRK